MVAGVTAGVFTAYAFTLSPLTATTSPVDNTDIFTEFPLARRCVLLRNVNMVINPLGVLNEISYSDVGSPLYDGPRASDTVPMIVNEGFVGVMVDEKDAVLIPLTTMGFCVTTAGRSGAIVVFLGTGVFFMFSLLWIYLFFNVNMTSRIPSEKTLAAYELIAQTVVNPSTTFKTEKIDGKTRITVHTDVKTNKK
jgi:hypothetical protein